MFESVTTLTTNVCGLGCSYCNFYGRPLTEATLEQKLEMLDVLASWPKSEIRFISLLGGDIIYMKGIKEFLTRMNELNLPYAMQTSAAQAQRMEELLPIIRNLSISTDPVANGDMFRMEKALCGFYWAGRAMERNPDLDVHSTITMDRLNFKMVPKMVKILSSLGIWSEITGVHWKKSEDYDLVPPRAVSGGFLPSDKPALEVIVDELIQMKKKGFKVHSSEKVLRMLPESGIDLDWMCKKPTNAVIEADLSLRLCLHIKGNRVTKWKITDLYGTDRWEEFLVDWRADYAEMCKGCSWDCQASIEDAKTQEEAWSWFDHKG